MSLPLPHISPRGRRHTIGHNNLKENCNDVHNPELITLRLRTDNIDKASIENKELLEKFESKIDNVEKRLMHTETRMEDINNKLEMLLNIVKNIFVNKPNGTPSYNQPRFDRGCSLENEDIIKITSAEANVFKFGDVDFVESADDFKNFSMKKASGKTVEGNISNISGLEFVESVDANKKDDMEGDVTPQRNLHQLESNDSPKDIKKGGATPVRIMPQLDSHVNEKGNDNPVRQPLLNSKSQHEERR